MLKHLAFSARRATPKVGARRDMGGRGIWQRDFCQPCFDFTVKDYPASTRFVLGAAALPATAAGVTNLLPTRLSTATADRSRFSLRVCTGSFETAWKTSFHQFSRA
jgi:hypothetical protein